MGYTFEGWYDSADYKNKVTEIAKGTVGEVNVYAKWKKDPKYFNMKYAKISKVKSYVYTGKRIKPNIIISINGKKLRINRDYKVVYSNNLKVGKATVTIKGYGQYSGVSKVFFIIKPSYVRTTLKWDRGLYARPGIKAKKIKTIKKNTKVLIQKGYSRVTSYGVWVKVKVGNRVGYMTVRN